MKQKTANLQNEIDKLAYNTVLKYIPNWLKPNHFTMVRIATVPLLFYLLYSGKVVLAFILFVLSASTDFVDGALARSRGQISDLGKILDPIADKLLISTVLIFVGLEYFIVQIFLIVIFAELIANLAGNLFSKILNIPIGANLYGKIKMAFQCLSVVIFIVGVIMKDEKIVLIAQYSLYVALFFALLSGAEQLRRSQKKISNKK